MRESDLIFASPRRTRFRQLQRSIERAMWPSVSRAHVAIVGGIGQLADADAIQHNPNHPLESMHRQVGIR